MLQKYLGILLVCFFFIACNSNNNENSTEGYDTSANANLSSSDSLAMVDSAIAKMDRSKTGSGTDTSTNNSSNSDTSSNSNQPGWTLIQNSNCLTCHKKDQKVVGPAYTAVANKYQGSDTAVNYLAHKIINGGSGVWGETAMPPHPELNMSQAKEMVHYILSLHS